MNNQEDILTQRLNKIYSWAQANGFNLIQGGGSGFSFSISGKNGKPLVTFYSKGKYKGEIYAYIAENNFLRGYRERDIFVNELKKIKLYDNKLDASKVDSHRYFRKKLQELTDEEMDNLLTILGKYCN
jgi:hypothetical protein